MLAYASRCGPPLNGRDLLLDTMEPRWHNKGMTTTRTSHTDCTHPATKADRAKCRKARQAQASVLAEPIVRDARFDYREVIEGYYQGTMEVEEIMAILHRIATDTEDNDLKATVASYYDGTTEVEEIMGAALRGVGVNFRECNWDDCHCPEESRTEKVFHTTYEGEDRTPIHHDGIMICRTAAIRFWTMKFNGYDHWRAQINGGAQKTLIATARRKLKALGVEV